MEPGRSGDRDCIRHNGRGPAPCIASEPGSAQWSPAEGCTGPGERVAVGLSDAHLVATGVNADGHREILGLHMSTQVHQLRLRVVGHLDQALQPCPSCSNGHWETLSGGDSVNDPYPDRK
jgi:hypothetical protein